MAYSAGEREKAARHCAFWQRNPVERPLVGATLNTFPPLRSVRSDGFVSPEDLDVEECLRQLDEEWEQWREVGGDAFWAANPLWPFPWHLAIAGCPVRRDGDRFSSLPALDSYDDLDQVKLDRSNPWFRKLIWVVQAISKHAAGRYPVGTGQLTPGPADLMLRLRGEEALARDLQDAPEKVLALGQRCARLCAEVLEAQYDTLPSYLGGYAGTVRYLWAPGKLVEMGENLSTMLSAAEHRRLVVPLHVSLGRRFPCTIVHVHSAQLHTLPNLLEIEELAAVQVTPEPGDDLLAKVPLLARILERKSLLVHGALSAETMKGLIRDLPPRGLAVFSRCQTPAEAAAKMSQVMS